MLCQIIVKRLGVENLIKKHQLSLNTYYILPFIKDTGLKLDVLSIRTEPPAVLKI